MLISQTEVSGIRTVISCVSGYKRQPAVLTDAAAAKTAAVSLSTAAFALSEILHPSLLNIGLHNRNTDPLLTFFSADANRKNSFNFIRIIHQLLIHENRTICFISAGFSCSLNFQMISSGSEFLRVPFPHMIVSTTFSVNFPALPGFWRKTGNHAKLPE
jgi:hypothetical protein